MSFELPKKETRCHHTGFEKTCCELVLSRACDRWRNLPGKDPFTGEARQQWGCVDDLVLFLQAETCRQADAGHSATTQLRELIFNPDYRARELAQPSDIKTIEAPDADHHRR